MSMLRHRGFTLVEVVVALAIVVIGLAALFTTTNQTAGTSSYLREKTFAQWIALNRITEARLAGQPPSDKDQSGELEFANRHWRWELKSIDTPVKGIVRLEAKVAPEGSRDNYWPGQATGFIGNAVVPPGAPPLNWLTDSTSPRAHQPGGQPPQQQPPGQPPENPGGKPGEDLTK